MTAVSDWVDAPSSQHGIHRAQSDGTWRWTSYHELAEQVRRLTDALAVLRDDHSRIVSLVISDPQQFAVAFTAVLRAGLVPSPLPTPVAFRGADRYEAHLASALQVAQPGLAITDHHLGDRVQRACAAAGVEPALVVLAADDRDPQIAERASQRRRTVGPNQGEPSHRNLPAGLTLLQFSSGSTGSPRAVCISRNALQANVEAIRRWLQLRADDTYVSWLPHYHDMGLIGAVITPLVVGADLWLMSPDQFVRNPLRWLECLGRHGVGATAAPCFGYSYAAARVAPEHIADLDFSGWRTAVLGAERIDPLAVHRFQQLVGPRGFDARAFVAAYGLAESTLAVTGVRPGAGSRLVHHDSLRVGAGPYSDAGATGLLGDSDVHGAGWLTSSGRPMPGMHVTVADERGAPLPAGSVGEILVHGPSIADGYLTSTGFAPFTRATLATGDAGVLIDAELYVIGRIGDAIKIRGTSVFAEDIETAIADLPGHAPVRCAVSLGTTRGQQNLAVVFVEHDVVDGWPEAAADRISVLTSGQADTLVLRGRRGSIARTSSGKPRRRFMWSALLTGEGAVWTPVRGELPAEMMRRPVLDVSRV